MDANRECSSTRGLGRSDSNAQILARVLVVDDEPNVRKAWRHMLNTGEFEVELCADAATACQRLAATPLDVVVTDVVMPGMTGLELLEYIKRNHPSVEVIVMTAQARIPDAVRATKLGAFDYITKPFPDVAACINRVRQAAKLKRLADENQTLRARPQEGGLPEALRSKSPAMREVINQVERVARVDINVVISGPTGTGKTLLARAIHDLSRRKTAEFVHVDCGTIPQNLIESELFGHVKGAYTGALVDRPGLFETASGGTIFLDEIGNLPIELQPKLLRVLNDSVLRPVGGQKDIKVDVRVLSATNVDLRREVELGRFREDLFYRLRVVEIKMPPLNERREDIPSLVYGFLTRFANRTGSRVRTVRPDCMDRLARHDWKGNVRDLLNVVEQALVFETSEELTDGSLPPELRTDRQLATNAPVQDLINPDLPWNDTIPAAENTLRSAYLRSVLEKCEGNVTQAAKHAGLDRSNFRRHLRKHLPDYTDDED